MKGVIFNLLEDVVVTTHGSTAWENLLDAAGVGLRGPGRRLAEHLALGTVDLGFQRREVLLAVLQQRDRVAREELHQPTGSRSAVSAAWSEMRAHGAP